MGRSRLKRLRRRRMLVDERRSKRLLTAVAKGIIILKLFAGKTPVRVYGLLLQLVIQSPVHWLQTRMIYMYTARNRFQISDRDVRKESVA